VTVSRPNAAVHRSGPPTNRRGAHTRAHIIATAGDLFGSQGFFGTSIREIAAGAGVNHATLLHHFESKEVLLEAVLEEREQQVYRLVDASVPRHDFREFYRRLTLHNESVPGLIALFARTSVDATNVSHPLHEQFRARYERIVLNMTTEFHALQQLGLLLPGVKPDEAARTLIAAQDGAQIQWLYDPEGVDINDIIQGLLDTLLTSPPTATGAAS
jgi:AcrR family transcriptional regulator